MTMSSPVPADRQALLSLTPQVYLSRGYRKPDGAAWKELTTTWSLAAAEQLRASGITPKQLDAVLGPVARQALASRGDALQSAQGALMGHLGDPGLNEGVRDFLQNCIFALRSPEDLEPLAEHLASVLQLLSINGAIRAAKNG